jgi:hypothetical protein
MDNGRILKMIFNPLPPENDHLSNYVFLPAGITSVLIPRRKRLGTRLLSHCRGFSFITWNVVFRTKQQSRLSKKIEFKKIIRTN